MKICEFVKERFLTNTSGYGEFLMNEFSGDNLSGERFKEVCNNRSELRKMTIEHAKSISEEFLKKYKTNQNENLLNLSLNLAFIFTFENHDETFASTKHSQMTVKEIIKAIKKVKDQPSGEKADNIEIMCKNVV